jgi:hypothetical protein
MTKKTKEAILMILIMILVFKIFLEPFVVYQPQQPDQALANFAGGLRQGIARQVVGVYSQDVMAFPVWQQPYHEFSFVYNQPDVVTEYRPARDATGNIGLMAHNNMAGKQFYKLDVGSVVSVVFGDGSVSHFQVVEVQRYQIINDYEVLDLQTGQVTGTGNVFYLVYGGDYRLVLQTCITQDGNPEWGRMFWIAKPYDIGGDA